MVYVQLGVVEQFVELTVPVAMAIEVVIDCVLDVVLSLLEVALFLYYWDKRQAEFAVEKAEVAEADAMGATWEPDELKADPNPYRPPRT